MASYTLILSRGTHFVNETDGEAILTAIANSEPTVTVDLDMIGDGFLKRGVRLATAHVVAVIPNDDDEETDDQIPFGPNVTALRPQRLAR